MDDTDELSRQPSLQEIEPSPVEETPSSAYDDYFPPTGQDDRSSSNSGDAGARPASPPKRSSTFGLNSHSPIWYLTRIQRYSSYTFTIFTAFHITNTSLIPLVTQSVPASEPYLLLTRPYYQSPIAEPLLIALPLVAHVGAGLALRLYRRRQNLEMYGAESRSDRRKVAWPKLSGTSLLGYAFLPLLAGHAFVNRVVPLQVQGGSSSINLSYVSHAFAKHPAVSFAGFGALITVGVWHNVWGWAKYLDWTPAAVTRSGNDGQISRKRRWYVINAVAAVIAGLWMAGGMGVVGRAGEVGGWVGREYDELYRSIPLVGRWM